MADDEAVFEEVMDNLNESGGRNVAVVV